MNLRPLPARRAGALLALLVSLGSPAALALQTEDADVLEAGACEIEIEAQRLRAGAEREYESGAAAQCGVGWDTQLNLGLARARAEGERARLGAIGGKMQLWRAGEEGAALALAYGISAERRAAGWRQSERELALLATVPLASVPALAALSRQPLPLVVHINLGHVQETPTRLTTTTWGVALEHEGFAMGGLRWAPMAEVTGDDRGSPWLGLGLKVELVQKRLSVDASWGRQQGDGRAELLSLGLKLKF